jgi:hypothetical protein
MELDVVGNNITVDLNLGVMLKLIKTETILASMTTIIKGVLYFHIKGKIPVVLKKSF